MKKTIIIIGAVIVVIVAILVLTVTLAPQTLPAIKQAAQTDQALANDAKMKALTTQVMIMVLKYDQSDTTNVSFIKNPSNVTALNAFLGQFSQQNNVSITPSILTTNSDEVVKLQVVGSNSFYCADAAQTNAGVISVPISGNNFTSSTDCTGQTLK